MRSPWHVRAWATGASLAINGALVLGVLQINTGSTMAPMDDSAILVSLGDPALAATDNATSPDARPTPVPEPPPATATPPPEPVKPRETPPRPDGYLAQAAVRPLAPPTAPAEASKPAAATSAAAAPAGARAMTSTAAKPPVGVADADSVQVHAGSSTSYAARVRAWLESNKTYPKAARLRKQQGTARLVFVIDRAGHVLDCRLVGPTGHALLDQEALAMVSRSDPFPAPPHTVRGERIELEAPVAFSLER